MNGHYFIQFFKGNKYLGAGYVKDKSTPADRKRVARQKGILYYDAVLFGKHNKANDRFKFNKYVHDFKTKHNFNPNLKQFK